MSELHKVAEGGIQRERASCQCSIQCAASVLDLHFQRSKRAGPVRHSGCGDRVSDENELLRAFDLEQQLDHCWIHVNTVGNDICGHVSVRENLGEKSWPPVVERTHSVECMSRVTRAGADCVARATEVRIRMPEADANPALDGLRNNFDGILQFRRNGHNSYLPPRRLPKSFKSRHVRNQQVFRQMHSATRMAEKRTLEMNAERTRAPISVGGLDGVSQVL